MLDIVNGQYLIRPAKINTGNKISLTSPFDKILFDLQDDPDEQSIHWYLYDDQILAISSNTLDNKDYERVGPLHTSVTKILDEGRYIRPPEAVPLELREQFTHGTQTVRDFLTDLTGINEDTLAEFYRDGMAFFDSRSAFQDALNGQMPRFAFLMAHQSFYSYQSPVWVLSQQQLSATYKEIPEPLEILDAITYNSDIFDDERILVALGHIRSELSNEPQRPQPQISDGGADEALTDIIERAIEEAEDDG
jgi:regulatory protein YycH of two-component signal transduction system YycFG